MTNPNEQKAADLASDLENRVARIQRLAGLGDRADRAWEAAIGDLTGEALSIEQVSTIEVLLGTGGPACGIVFDVTRRDHGWWVCDGGRVWWQDWYTPRSYYRLDRQVAGDLFDLYGLEGFNN